MLQYIIIIVMGIIVDGKKLPDKVINNLKEGIKQYRFNPLAKSSMQLNKMIIKSMKEVDE